MTMVESIRRKILKQLKRRGGTIEISASLSWTHMAARGLGDRYRVTELPEERLLIEDLQGRPEYEDLPEVPKASAE